MKNQKWCQYDAGRPSYGKKKIGQTGSGNPTTVATAKYLTHCRCLTSFFPQWVQQHTADSHSDIEASHISACFSVLDLSISRSHASLTTLRLTRSHLRGRWFSQPFDAAPPSAGGSTQQVPTELLQKPQGPKMSGQTLDQKFPSPQPRNLDLVELSMFTSKSMSPVSCQTDHL